MRERAEAARFWFPANGHDGMDEVPWHTSEDLSLNFDKKQGPHMAGWSPAAALAAARLLERIAAESEAGLCICDADHFAVALARAYLGEQS